MRKFVPTDGAEGAIAEILGYTRFVKDWMLHDPGWKDDLIAGWIVICVHSRHCHVPLIVPGWLAKLGPFLFNLELGHIKAVPEIGGV